MLTEFVLAYLFNAVKQVGVIATLPQLHQYVAKSLITTRRIKQLASFQNLLIHLELQSSQANLYVDFDLVWKFLL